MHVQAMFCSLLIVNTLCVAGTRVLYSFIRRELDVPFYYSQATPDVMLEKISAALRDQRFSDVICDIFGELQEEEELTNISS